MRLRLILVLVVFLPVALYAQDKRIVVQGFSQSGVSDVRARTSPVYDNNKHLTALIVVSLVDGEEASFEGIVGEPVYRMGSWFVHVAEGTPSIKVYIPGCKSIEYSFPDMLQPQSGVVYLLNLSTEAVVKLRTLIMPIYSYNQSQDSYGLMLGVCKTHGAYIKAKTNFVFNYSTNQFRCYANGVIEGSNWQGWYTGNSSKSRISFTAGYMFCPFNFKESSSLYLYAGVGGGIRSLLWETYTQDGEYRYAEVIPSSFRGLELETGLIFRWKGLAVTAGAQTTQFKYFEANLGLGIMF